MKITHFFTRYPHPYQPYNKMLIERQKQSGLQCSIFSFNGRGVKENYWVSLILSVINGLHYFTFSWRFRNASGKSLMQSVLFVGKVFPVLRQRPDLIHIHHVQILTQNFITFFSLLRIPCVISLRGSDTLVYPLTNETAGNFFKTALRFVHGIHTVSAHLREVALQYGIAKEKIFVIRRTSDSVDTISRNVSFDTGEIILTSIGRFNWTKGFVFLLQALRRLRDEGYSVKLQLIGDGKEEERAEIRYWIRLLELDDVVCLHGFLSSEQINVVLGSTHIYIQPSISEGIPNTLIRVVANKIPIIATKVGGIPEIITEDHGLLVPAGDERAIADAARRIIDKKEFRNQLYQKPIEISFDPQTEMDAYKNFYRYVVEIFHVNHSTK